MYAVSHQNKPSFNTPSTGKLFSNLKGNEFDISRIRDSTKAGVSDEDAPQALKGAALKAATKEVKKQPKEKGSTDDLATQYALMTERFNKMESKLKKFNKFRKRNFKGKEKEYQPHYSKEKTDDKKSSNTNLKDVESFGCR